jgi:hypothetical protein
MFLGKAIYETLDQNGELHSHILTPGRHESRLVADEISDIDRRTFRARSVDIGPLRMYAEQSGIGYQFISARLTGNAFNRSADRISVNINHSEIPLSPGTAGYYGLLLPRGFSGTVGLKILVAGENQGSDPKTRFLEDTQQIFIASSFRLYNDQWATPHISARANLVAGRLPGMEMELTTFHECFGGFIDGLYDESVSNLIRHINASPAKSASKVFICHSSADKYRARRIANALAGRGVRIWIDEAEIRVGDSLIDKIEKGIISSTNLVVVLTPYSVNSSWCKEELRMALAMQIGGESIRVLPALFDECEIPGFLKDKAYADFRDPNLFHETIDQLEAAIG